MLWAARFFSNVARSIRSARLMPHLGVWIWLLCLWTLISTGESMASDLPPQITNQPISPLLLPPSDRLVGQSLANSFSFGSSVGIVTSGGDANVPLPVDLDKDGQVDMTYGDGSALQIARNTAGLSGMWSTIRSVGTAAGEIVGLVTGDLNRDGRPDLVTAAGTEIQLWGNPGAAFDQAWVVGTSLTVGVQHGAVAVADLDRDGALDIVAGGADGIVRLWRNPLALQGDLTNAWSIVKELPALGGAITEVEIGDLDRDGRPDLIVVNGGASPSISLWHNPGAAFSADWVESVDLSGGGTLSLPAAECLVVADLDRDNRLDLVVGDEIGTVYGLRNPGTAPFSGAWGTWVALGSVDGALSSLISADLDNDATLELIGIVESTPAQVVAWENGGNPFGTAWTMSPIGTDDGSLAGVCSADLDSDGDLDIVTGGQGGVKAWPNRLSPWGVGFGSTGHSVGMGAISNTRITALVVVDLDGDGDSDLVSGEQYSDRIMAWQNDGTPFDGSWTGQQVKMAPGWGELLALAAGDLDNDGDMDLVAGYYSDYGPKIWQNDGTPFEEEWSGRQLGTQYMGTLELADIDGDGRLDIISGGGGYPNACEANPNEDNPITVWYAPTSPFSDTWQATEVGLAYSVLDLAVGDLDNDGDYDIVIGTCNAPAVGDVGNPVPMDQWTDAYQIRAFRNNGGDNWTAFDVGRDPKTETLPHISSLGLYHGYWGAAVTDVALVDLDDDGDLDIAATERIEGDFQVMGWQNDGTPFSGELWAPSAVAKGETHNWLLDHVWWVEPGDFDRDGDLDLVAGSGPGEGGDGEPYQVMVWQNSGVAFGSAISETAWVRHNVGVLGEQTRTGGVADFDRDGDLDLVAGTFAEESNEIRLWENHLDPDLALDIAPSSQAVVADQVVVTYTAVVTGLYGFNQPVDLWVSGLPLGLEATWSRNPLRPPDSSVLTLTMAPDGLLGDYPLLAVATGGEFMRTAPFTLTVIEQTDHQVYLYLPLMLRAH